jgi:hypothetical protein
LTKTGAPDFATGWTTLSLAGYATESWVQAGFYPLTGNPSGFITNAALAPYLTSATAASTYQTLAGMSAYATQSFVTSQGYITSADLSPYLLSSTAASTYAVIAAGQPASGTVGQVLTKQSGSDYDSSWQTLIPGDRYLTTSTTSLTINNDNKTLTVGTGLSYTLQQDVIIAYDANNHMHAQVLTYNSVTGVMTVDVRSHSGSGTFSLWTVNVGGTVPMASIVWGDITGILGNQADLSSALNAKLEVTTAASTYFTIASAAGKANLSGATFTGKVNLPTRVSGGEANLNLGAIPDNLSAPTTLVAGDVFLTDIEPSTGNFNTRLNYVGRTFSGALATIQLAALNGVSNFFSQTQTVVVTSTTPAVRIQQLGTGDAFRVEDENPENSPFVINQFGKVGIGVAPDATAALKVDTNGIMFGNGSVQTVAANPFTGGAITSPITYAGAVYNSQFGSDLIEVKVNGSSDQSYQAAGGFYTSYNQIVPSGGTSLRQVYIDKDGLSNTEELTSLGGHNVFIKPTFFSSSVYLPSEQTESFELTKNGIQCQRVNPAGGGYQTIRFSNDGVQFSDGSVQTSAANTSGLASESWVSSGFYPLSGNPSGFIDSSTASSSFYPLSGNPSGFMSSPGSGSYVWYSGGWYSANLTTVLDSSYNYVNVLTF